MKAKGWEVNVFYDSVIVTNLHHNRDERVVVTKNEAAGRIKTIDVARGDNPTRVTRLDARVPYEEVVSEEGGTLVWPMK